MRIALDLAGALLCALGRHNWRITMVDRRTPLPLNTERCTRRGCRLERRVCAQCRKGVPGL